MRGSKARASLARFEWEVQMPGMLAGPGLCWSLRQAFPAACHLLPLYKGLSPSAHTLCSYGALLFAPMSSRRTHFAKGKPLSSEVD